MAKHFKGDTGAAGEKDRALAAAVAPRGNVFTRFTLRSLKANRVRTTVTIVGVALATGLLMAVLASVTSLQAALVNYMRSTNGVWQESFDYTDDATLGNLRTLAGGHLDRLATRRDLGAVALSEDNASYAGTYLGLYDPAVESAGTPRAAGDTDYAVYSAPEVEEGRLPEKPGEIALPSYLRGEELTAGASQVPGVDGGATSTGELELGSEITLAAGRRVWLAEPETPIASGQAYQIDYGSDAGESGTAGAADETPLETLTNVGEPRTYTVVGFVNTGVSDGNVAYVSMQEPAATASGDVVTTAFFSTTGYSSKTELSDLMERVLGEDGSWVSNDSLLTYQGLDTGRQMTTSLQLFAGVLAAVIVVAAISLISNAFTISISERTRQFGLLASLGASRRQLRRTVYTEAAVIGLVGIPLGVALGVGGAAAAFALTAEGWSMIVGNGVTVGLVLRPTDFAAAVAISPIAPRFLSRTRRVSCHTFLLLVFCFPRPPCHALFFPFCGVPSPFCSLPVAGFLPRFAFLKRPLLVLSSVGQRPPFVVPRPFAVFLPSSARLRRARSSFSFAADMPSFARQSRGAQKIFILRHHLFARFLLGKNQRSGTDGGCFFKFLFADSIAFHAWTTVFCHHPRLVARYALSPPRSRLSPPSSIPKNRSAAF